LGRLNTTTSGEENSAESIEKDSSQKIPEKEPILPSSQKQSRRIFRQSGKGCYTIET
jgi:hypothetical protein